MAHCALKGPNALLHPSLEYKVLKSWLLWSVQCVQYILWGGGNVDIKYYSLHGLECAFIALLLTLWAFIAVSFIIPSILVQKNIFLVIFFGFFF